MHYVAGLTAKLRRIHVSRAAITGHRYHKQVHDGSDQHNIQAVTKNPVVKIDFGKLSWDLPCLLQFPAAHKHAHWDQQQSQYKEPGQDQEEDNSEIWIVVWPAEKLYQPIADHGYASSAGNGAASETDGIVAEKQCRPDPVLAESLKHCYVAPGPKNEWPVSDYPSDEEVLLGL